jgi:hypothetical protein
MQKPTAPELFSMRVDSSRVAAARAISKIDRSQLTAFEQNQELSFSLTWWYIGRQHNSFLS